jgi:predicted nucleic acid-binding protein
MKVPAVFVDASAYVAALRSDDAHHQEAMTLLAGLNAQGSRLVTTTFVVAETHALLLRYLGGPAARRFLQNLDASRVTTIVHPLSDDIIAAKTLLYRYTDKDFSLADAVSFVVIARLGLTASLTFDGHFRQYGLRVL